MLNINQQDNRKYARIAEVLPVRFKFSDRLESSWQEAQTHNLSEAGLFVAGRIALKDIGEVVHLDLWLDKDGKPLRIICQVAWVKRSEETAIGLGLKILQVEPDHKQTYLTYIYQRITPEQKAFKIKFLRQSLANLPDKERRCYQILDYIRRRGPVSKVDIVNKVNLNAVSVGKFIDEFLKIGIVFDCGFDESSGGRRAQLFRLNRDFGLILGLEVNEEQGFIRGLVTNLELEIILEERKLLIKQQDTKAVLIDFIRSLLAQLGQKRSQILGLGIGFDDIKEHAELEREISKEFGLPVAIEEGFHLEPFAQSWIVRELANKNILYVHSGRLLSLILGGDIYKPEREIEGKAELSNINLQDKTLALIELLSPDIVYIAKRVERELPQLKQALKEKLAMAHIRQAEEIKVLSADVEEGKAVVLGAISLAMKEVFIGID